MSAAIVFGGSGQIGASCADALRGLGMDVLSTGRTASEDGLIAAYDPLVVGSVLPGDMQFDAVVWAQGANINDSIETLDLDRHRQLYDANVSYILASLKQLIASGRLAEKARLCVISSVWQCVARNNKLSYMITKSALQGLVMSVAVDLADRGVMINAVLPGALDTPMTRQNLSADQIDRLAAMTPFGRLPAIADVANLAAFLCSPANSSITGQFVAVDLGFSNARLV